MLIVMLNFLIAEVGNTYSKASMLGEKFHYRERAILNYQTQKYHSYFKNRSRYNILAFSTPRESFKDEDQDNDKEIFNVAQVVKVELDSIAKLLKREITSARNDLQLFKESLVKMVAPK